jgi:hypothetical protein
MKNFIPTSNKGMRKLKAKNFDIVTINEYKTLKLCHNYCSENDNKLITIIVNFIKYEFAKTKSVVLLWNRNLNCGLNILRILKEFINNRKKIKEFK